MNSRQRFRDTVLDLVEGIVRDGGPDPSFSGHDPYEDEVEKYFREVGEDEWETSLYPERSAGWEAVAAYKIAERLWSLYRIELRESLVAEEWPEPFEREDSFEEDDDDDSL